MWVGRDQAAAVNSSQAARAWAAYIIAGPPTICTALARTQPSCSRVQPTLHTGEEQSNPSTLDLGDRRTASPRNRTNRRSFFLNGATNRGWVSAGADGAMATADDLLTATGETIAQIQDRVLGVGVNSGVLFSAVPGYVTGGIRAGLKFGAHQIIVDAQNLNDENYRGISWGIDAPGRAISAKYVARF